MRFVERPCDDRGAIVARLFRGEGLDESVIIKLIGQRVFPRLNAATRASII
jgi:hypothetical protein